MKIIRRIPIKQVLTEESKMTLSHTLQNEIEQLEKECQQLLFEHKRFERMKKGHSERVESSFLKEIEKRKNRIKAIQFQLQQLEIIPLGTEIKETEVEAVVDIEVGNRWNEVVKEIVIENGIVKEIRKG